MKRLMKASCVAAAALCGGIGPTWGATSIAVSLDHVNGLYAIGEAVTFTVTVTDTGTGKPATSGTASWSLSNFGGDARDSGAADLSVANPFVVSGTLPYAGFLKLNVVDSSTGWRGKDFTAMVMPDEMGASSVRPAEFDEFWTAAKSKLEAEVLIDVRMTPNANKSTSTYDYYDISFATFGRRVYGFYTEPKDTSKKYPALVSIPWEDANSVSSSLGAADRVTLLLNAIDVDPVAHASDFSSAFSEWRSELLAKYNVGNNAYGAAGIASSKEDYVFYSVLLGMNRAVEWLRARACVDPGRVVFRASSQGAGLGLMLMGLNGHFARGAVTLPAMCDHSSHLASPQRTAGWPGMIANQGNSAQKPAAAGNMTYFDAVHFAAAVTCPVRIYVGLSDTTCPPAGGWCAYNALASTDKYILGIPNGTHAEDATLSAQTLAWALGTSPARLTGYTDADGTTFAVADHVLSIMVPHGVTNDYDYTAFVFDPAVPAACDVTNIVVTTSGDPSSGEAVLLSRPLASYRGDFVIRDNAVFAVRGANALGVNADAVADGGRRVTVCTGGTIDACADADSAVKGLSFVVSGEGCDGKGALRGNGKRAVVTKSQINLAADATSSASTVGRAWTTGNEFTIAGEKARLSFWEIDYAGAPAVCTNEVFTLASGFSCTATFQGGAFPAGNYRLAFLPADITGVTASQFEFSVVDGMTGAVSVKTAAEGQYKGWTLVSLAVVPNVLPAAESLSNVDGLGTSVTVAGQIMTITVPAGQTSTYDYTALAAKHYVSNIVLNGQGVYKPGTGSQYRGDWHILSGEFQVNSDDAFGAVVPNGYEPQVFVHDGAFLYMLKDANYSFYRTIHLSGNGRNDGQGALSYYSDNGGNFRGTLETWFVLDSETEIRLTKRRGPLGTSVIDFNGYDLVVRSGGTYGTVNAKLINTSEAPSKLRFVEDSNAKPQIGVADMEGGSENELSFEIARLFMLSEVKPSHPGSWTLVARGGDNICSATRGLGAKVPGWSGPMRLENDARILNTDDDNTSGHVVGLGGPLQGAASRTLKVQQSIFCMYSAENTFAGTIDLAGGSKETAYRNALVLTNGANVSCKTIKISDSDLIMDDAADRRFPPVAVSTADSLTPKSKTTGLTGEANIIGGTVGTVFEQISVTGPNVFTLDSPSTVEVLSVAQGTLALSSTAEVLGADRLPAISNVVFASGTTFDMHGHALSVRNWRGVPTVANAADLTLTGSLAVDGVDLAADSRLKTDGRLVFGAGAVVTVANAKRAATGELVLATARSGVVLPEGGLMVMSDRNPEPIPAKVSADGKSLTFANAGQGTVLIFR